MTEEQITQIKTVLKDTIQEKVNGKVDKIHLILEKQNEATHAFHDKVEQHIEADKLWKADVTPQIQLVKDTQGFGKVSLYFLGFVSALGGCILLIYNLLKLR
jgi:hypothetical protein